MVDQDFLAFQSAVAGQYSLERELGRGGMGIVYLAREVRLERPVAIKVLPPALGSSAEFRARFLREARTAAQLSHPNIVPIHRVDEVGDWVFFVMSYIEGETLGERVRARGPLPAHQVARVLRETAWALAYAHLRGIVHRDVKPDNILLERGSGRALVTDFGIAQVAASSAAAGAAGAADPAEPNAVLGTAQFVSPEQAAGSELDGRSDLYSLGVVGFYAASGRLPFDAATPGELLVHHLRTPAPPAAAAAPGLPRPLAAAIDRCLAKDPAARFATGEQLAEAVEHAGDAPREIPAPVRVWLAKGEQIRPVGILATIYGVPATIALGIEAGPLAALIPASLVLAVAGIPRLLQTRRTLAAGYGYEDLRLGLRQHIARRREELEFEYGEEIGATSSVAGNTLAASAVVFAASVWALNDQIFHFLPLWAEPVAGVALALSAITGGVSTVKLIRQARHRKVGSLRLRFWESRFGRRLVELAGLNLKTRATPEQIMHHPTEVLLGRATDTLFAALPKALRQEFKELPALVRRLEEDARLMRRQVEELGAALADASGDLARRSAVLAHGAEDAGVAGSVTEHRDRTVDALRVARDEANRRLGVAVAALENIRLDLLRLQGSAAPEPAVTASLTASLQAAERLGAELRIQAEAREEADAVVRKR